MNPNRMWIIGSSVLTVAILAAGWFIGVSPTLAMAAVSETDRQSAEQQNASYEQTLADLKARYEKLPELTSEIERISVSLPAEQKMSSFLTELTDIGTATGTVITGVTVSDALPYLPIVPDAEVTTDPEAATEEAADGEEATAQADAAMEPVAEVTPLDNGGILNAELVTAENFIATPINLSVEGDLDQVMAFVDGLQRGERLYLVTKLSFTRDAETSDYAAEIEGMAYSLLPIQTAPAAADPGSPTAAVTVN